MQILSVASLFRADENADFSFDTDQRVSEPFHAVPLQVEPSQQFEKSYGLSDDLFQRFDGSERVLFAARDDGNLAGYLAASRGWNGCAMIDDFAVARKFRRRGLATALMGKAVDWSRDSGLGAIRLETQSNNVAACLFYQRFGFVLGGYDRFLYRELGPDKSSEVAMFWYLKVDSPVP